MSNDRSSVFVGQTYTYKRFVDPQLALWEVDWYNRVPWACPQLVDYDPVRLELKIKTLPQANHHRGWRDPEGLHDLLTRLAELGIHHRDVWPGNIVISNDNTPLLIDWETAIEVPPTFPSYDLYGPEDSLIAPPIIHRAIRSKRSPNGYAMWVAADHPCSVKSMWGVDLRELSAEVDRR